MCLKTTPTESSDFLSRRIFFLLIYMQAERGKQHLKFDPVPSMCSIKVETRRISVRGSNQWFHNVTAPRSFFSQNGGYLQHATFRVVPRKSMRGYMRPFSEDVSADGFFHQELWLTGLLGIAFFRLFREPLHHARSRREQRAR